MKNKMKPLNEISFKDAKAVIKAGFPDLLKKRKDFVYEDKHKSHIKYPHIQVKDDKFCFVFYTDIIAYDYDVIPANYVPVECYIKAHLLGYHIPQFDIFLKK